MVVNSTLTSIAVSPPSTNLTDSQTQQLTATGFNQFGGAISPQPTFTWSLSSGSVGSVNSTGLYTAPSSPLGTATVLVTSGSVQVSANLVVTYLKGDYNLDGQCDGSDLNELLNALTDISSYEIRRNLNSNDLPTLGDLDGDGALTNLDIQAMISLLISGSPPALNTATSLAASTADLVVPVATTDSQVPQGDQAVSSSQIPSSDSLELNNSTEPSPMAKETSVGNLLTNIAPPLSISAGLPGIKSHLADLIVSTSIPSPSRGTNRSIATSGTASVPVMLWEPIELKPKNEGQRIRSTVIISHAADTTHPLVLHSFRPLDANRSAISHLSPRNRRHEVLAVDETISNWPSAAVSLK